MADRNTQIEMMEITIKSWVLAEIHPEDIAIALSNAFAHGRIINEAGFWLDKNDKTLGKVYDGIDQFRIGCKMIPR